MDINITFDLETCALCPTAAVMSIGAVAWNADAEDNPFTEGLPGYYCFYRHVDLRSSFVDGFTFDGKTSEWWATQNEGAKKALLEYDDVPLRSIDGVIEDFFGFIQHVQEETSAKNVKLWSQGTDFDIAILRNICGKYDIEIPVSYKNFRDHRTFFLEGAKIVCGKAGVDFDERKAYQLVEKYDGPGEPHNPVFDCKRSIFSTWQMMKRLRGLNIAQIVCYGKADLSKYLSDSLHRCVARKRL